MDIKEKLVEFQSIIACPNAICNFCEHFKNKGACEKHKKEVIADNMIAHGVTVQEWISVDDRLPEPKENAICINRHGDMMIGTYTEWGWMFHATLRALHTGCRCLHCRKEND